jgi:lysophospholipase L1-like esterase
VNGVSFDGDERTPLVVQQLTGLIEFFGVVLEGSEPGVVLDTLGIDGAKARTLLAWQADAWKREIRERNPELAVFAYGTNEVFETLEPSEYGHHFRDLVARVREAVPSVDCLLVGPTDVMHHGESHERVEPIAMAQRETAGELGCAYIGAHELMGGKDGYATWSKKTPRLAGKDGVHLTVSGYEELGERTATFLLSSYDQWLR